MAKQTDFSKLKKDELLKKIGSKLSKDQLVNLAQGLQNGSVTGDQFDAAVGQTTGVWPQPDTGQAADAETAAARASGGAAAGTDASGQTETQ
jgi:hypothetical protein